MSMRVAARAFCSARAAPKRASQTVSKLAEIMGGEHAATTRSTRLPAGDVLRLIDLAAARTAIGHFAGEDGRLAPGSGCVTLSFDRVDLMVPILQGDLLQFNARMLSVGTSSMVVQVDGKKRDRHTRKWVPTSCSLVTFVAVGPDKRPTPVAPLLNDLEGGEEDAESAARRRELANEWAQRQSEVRARARSGKLSAAVCDEPLNRAKQEKLRLKDTTVTLTKMWMPRNLNVNGSIFGGDLLAWMERGAHYCASAFTRSAMENMVTLSMGRVFFYEPIFTTDLVELEAVCVYATQHTVQVEVCVNVSTLGSSQNEEKRRSHRGHFTVLNLDEFGNKRPVLAGFDLDAADEVELSLYEQGKERHRFFKEYDQDMMGQHHLHGSHN